MPGKTTCPEIRKLIVDKHVKGFSSHSISASLNCPQSTVSRIIRLFKQTGDTEAKKSPGRPRKTNPTMKRLICRKSKADRFRSAKQISHMLPPHDFSIRTIQRRLCENQLVGHIAQKKPLVNQKNKKVRYEWAKEHMGWSNSKWSRVLFSDESKIQRISSRGIVYVRRKKNKKYKICCTRPTVQGGGGGLMVWACMTAKGPGPIIRVDGHVNAKKYIDILTNVVEPYMDQNMPIASIFQHDNAPCHKAKTVCDKSKEMGLQVLPWPAQSPDLNPIENAWKVLKSRVSCQKYANVDELWQAVQKNGMK